MNPSPLARQATAQATTLWLLGQRCPMFKKLRLVERSGILMVGRSLAWLNFVTW